ncbi:uncharacterized protein LAESUDRAFT_397482 [Laetiporus sulphureus 93-53]|uniref:Uncharacterized protein n=1 Tax=Laetiporus sulphureus 93-53 TaxID=1314785 RepID=A0A165CF23_9APHY|nr:uncharacterized protein LAESUDRAFT_397482 [Laetiporus sulphureus 93-53]KZT02697.1 hypothetical protein LAESUDRAFT_397482 [Laetiporus sulphureus 93-53]
MAQQRASVVQPPISWAFGKCCMPAYYCASRRSLHTAVQYSRTDRQLKPSRRHKEAGLARGRGCRSPMLSGRDGARSCARVLLSVMSAGGPALVLSTDLPYETLSLQSSLTHTHSSLKRAPAICGGPRMTVSSHAFYVQKSSASRIHTNPYTHAFTDRSPELDTSGIKCDSLPSDASCPPHFDSSLMDGIRLRCHLFAALCSATLLKSVLGYRESGLAAPIIGTSLPQPTSGVYSPMYPSNIEGITDRTVTIQHGD